MAVVPPETPPEAIATFAVSREGGSPAGGHLESQPRQSRARWRGSRRREAGVVCRWMWADGRRLEANPLHWSLRRGPLATAAELEKQRHTRRNRPVRVHFYDFGSGDKIEEYDSAEIAAAELRQLPVERTSLSPLPGYASFSEQRVDISAREIHRSPSSPPCVARELPEADDSLKASPPARGDLSEPDSWQMVVQKREKIKVRIATLGGKVQERCRTQPRVTQLREKLLAKRELAQREDTTGQVGLVEGEVLGGRFCVSRPYFIIEVDGNETRTKTAQCSPKGGEATWGEGEATFALPVFDPSSDLRLYLFDDHAVRHEKCCGCVIVPLSALCSDGLLPAPRSSHCISLRIGPATRQNGRELLMRYQEAVPRFPGSGMVYADLGTVHLRVQLRLTAPFSSTFGLLAAYADAAPLGRAGNEDGDADEDEGDDEAGIASKAVPGLRLMNGKDAQRARVRFLRFVQPPALLERPWCFGLLVAHWWACFRAQAYHVPPIAFALALANGVLMRLHRRRRLEKIIFWEDAVGEALWPSHWQKFNAIRRNASDIFWRVEAALGGIERLQSALNFEDPPVTVIAFGVLFGVCAALSSLLRVLPLRVIPFTAGTLALGPFLAKDADSDWKDLLQQTKERFGSNGSSKRRPLPPLAEHVANVLARAPDGKEAAHRYFCSEQVVRNSQGVLAPPLKDIEAAAAEAPSLTSIADSRSASH